MSLIRTYRDGGGAQFAQILSKYPFFTSVNYINLGEVNEAPEKHHVNVQWFKVVGTSKFMK